MKHSISLLAAMLISLSVLAGEHADTVYTNGKIYTMNEAQPWAEAVAMKDGKFIAVGDTADITTMQGPDTMAVDLDGAFAMAGLIDPHTHASLSMKNRVFCELPGTFFEPTEEEILSKIQACKESYPTNLEWFVADGFTTSVMSKDKFNKRTLDEIFPNQPAYIIDESGHNAWVNTKALEIAGITKDTPDTEAGFYSRDPGSNEPTGRVFEEAMNTFIALVPPLSLEHQKTALMKMQQAGSEQGITAQGDAYTFEAQLEAWQSLHQNDELIAHTVLYMDGNFGDDKLTPIKDLVARYENYDLPGPRGIKMSLGGAIESNTEILVDGYGDGSSNPKSTLVKVEALTRYLEEADQHGFQLKIHAIGDGTVRAVLDGYEPVIEANGGNPNRHHIAHCSLVHPDDFPRLVELDVSCTAWSMLNAPNSYNLEVVFPKLKAETKARMYPNRSMLDAGVRLVNHSDSPNATLWPWWGMEASITRGFPGKPDIPIMNPDQAITLEEALIINTLTPAWSLRMEEDIGSIEVGKFADMIILNHNLFEIPKTDIHKTKVQKTIFKGEIVYEPG
jgi:predicted amidohydrolase YtcJ